VDDGEYLKMKQGYWQSNYLDGLMDEKMKKRIQMDRSLESCHI
jgi:hypothetical protein